jgi:uncharacterized membrane protein YcaP (DUF421 family)
MPSSIFFNGWESVFRIIISAAVIYVVIVLALRVAGEKALAKMSGFDLIVTVALGSLVATIPVTTSISIADGVAAIIAYLLLQEVTRYLQARSRHVRQIVRERPRLVVWDGQLLHDRMREDNLTDEEVRAAIRQAGLISLTQVQAAILENDGQWSIIQRSDAKDRSALEGLRVPAPDGAGSDEHPAPSGGQSTSSRSHQSTSFP